MVDIYEKYKDFKSANIFIDIDYDIEDIIVDEKREILDIKKYSDDQFKRVIEI